MASMFVVVAAVGTCLSLSTARNHLDLFRTVPDDALDAVIEAAGDPDSPLAFAELRHF